MTHTYETNDPRGWCGDPKRGAALGRGPGTHSEEKTPKLTLQRVRINLGGYDRLGTYWGDGRPLYWYATSTGSIDACLRANSRDDAKRQIRERYPLARFYR